MECIRLIKVACAYVCVLFGNIRIMTDRARKDVAIGFWHVDEAAVATVTVSCSADADEVPALCCVDNHSVSKFLAFFFLCRIGRRVVIESYE